MTKVKVEPKEIVYAIACAVGLKGQAIPCKGCGRELYFFPTVKGKRNPIDALTGISHWGNCPNAEEFRTKRIDG